MRFARFDSLTSMLNTTEYLTPGSNINVFVSDLPDQPFWPLPRIELSPVWKHTVSFFETCRTAESLGEVGSCACMELPQQAGSK